MEIIEFLNYPFAQRAILSGCLMALTSAVLGVFLVVRRFSLIGDGLAHISFFAVTLGLVLKTNPIYVSIPIVSLSSLGIFNLAHKTRIPPDSAIGIVSALGISLAIIIASLSGGLGVDIFGFLFGNILTVTKIDLIAASILFLVVLVFVYIFYNDLVCIAFNAECAKLADINVNFLNNFFVIIVGTMIVIALKLMGVMLVSTLLIFPAVTAMQFLKGFKTTIIIACGFSVFSVISGIIFSFIFNLPASGVIVLVNFMLFILAYGYKVFKKRI